jgi:hypothetical protein
MAPPPHMTGSRRSFRQQKQQTRLHFSPLPTSSPAKEGYSAAVQDRLAGVSYTGAKASSAEWSDDDEDEQDVKSNALPSPKTSSQIEDEDEAHGTFIAFTSQRTDN